ncbi:PRC-barrel domain-containing protein [Skermanella mucosa]|uniref:PRC-barrel domain-containing protein n=1 Tax=Skermanella mucosa TaxID=1789672 RepID=UPI00192C4D1E|nr:PRC-barrel domain-containing protein [Skermanella mucosa]UEM18575.1 PRC-barrel domain-containing protein [Skermanella mucosa]
MRRMSLTVGVVLAGLAAGAHAQERKLDEPLDSGRMGAGREAEGPAGNLLRERVPPDADAPRSGRPHQPAIAGGDGTAATNALTKIGEEAEADVERPPEPGADPAPLNTQPPTSVLGSRGGGALEADDVYADQLKEMEVQVSNQETIGTVSGVLIDIDAGRIAELMVSSAGLLDLTDQEFRVPWPDIRSIDKNDHRIRIDRRPEPAGDRETATRASDGRRLTSLADLTEMSVTVGRDGDFGEVARLVVDQSSGTIEQLTISAGGVGGTGLGDARYDVPWNAVASVDLDARRVMVDRTAEQLTSAK